VPASGIDALDVKKVSMVLISQVWKL